VERRTGTEVKIAGRKRRREEKDGWRSEVCEGFRNMQRHRPVGTDEGGWSLFKLRKQLRTQKKKGPTPALFRCHAVGFHKTQEKKSNITGVKSNNRDGG